MPVVITGKADQILDDLVNPARLIEADPAFEGTFRHILDMQHITNEAAVNRYGNRVAGGAGDIKVIARMPLRVLQGIFALEPDLIKSGKKLERFLHRNKIYRAYTEGTKF